MGDPYLAKVRQLYLVSVGNDDDSKKAKEDQRDFSRQALIHFDKAFAQTKELESQKYDMKCSTAGESEMIEMMIMPLELQ